MKVGALCDNGEPIAEIREAESTLLLAKKHYGLEVLQQQAKEQLASAKKGSTKLSPESERELHSIIEADVTNYFEQIPYFFTNMGLSAVLLGLELIFLLGSLTWTYIFTCLCTRRSRCIQHARCCLISSTSATRGT